MLLWFADLMNVTEEVMNEKWIERKKEKEKGRKNGSMNCNFFGYIH